jgi:hypothetical protein
LCNKFPLPIIFGEEFNLADTLPDLTQSKLWLDFANIYGLQFDVDQEVGIIRCNYIDDIIFNVPEDWTNKIDRTDRPAVSYNLGYAQKSYLKFTTDDICLEAYEKEVLIDDETLELETDIYVSPFFMIQPLNAIGTGQMGYAPTFGLKDGQNFWGAWVPSVPYFVAENQTVWHNGTYYKAKANSTSQEPPNATYWTPVDLTSIWTIKSRPMYGYLVTDPSSLVQVLFSGGAEQITKIIANINLDWNTSYDNHYRVFDRIKRKTKKVKALVRLNYSDVNQLDFTRSKKVDNELFIVEDITQFKLNRKDSTLVNLIRL